MQQRRIDLQTSHLRLAVISCGFSDVVRCVTYVVDNSLCADCSSLGEQLWGHGLSQPGAALLETSADAVAEDGTFVKENPDLVIDLDSDAQI